MEVIQRKDGNRYRTKIYFKGKELKSPYFRRKSDAQTWRRQKLADKDKANIYGSYELIQDKKYNFKDFSTQWLNDTIKTKNSHKTFKEYESTLYNHLIPSLANKNLSSINISDGQAIIHKLKSRNFKPKTIANIIMVLKGIFNEAEKMDIIIKNPLKYLQTPRIPKKVPRYWNAIETNKFLRFTRDDELYPLYVIALNTGCRRGELAALKWHQILFDGNLLEISATRDRFGRKETTKNGKNRFIGMNSIVRMTLLNLFKKRTSDDYVFVHADDSTLRVNHLYRYFKKAQVDTGLENIITFHNLRDTYASHYMMNGGNIYELQKILGHSSISMTQIYAHLSPKHLLGAAKVVNFGEVNEVSDSNRPYIGPKINHEHNILELNSIIT